MSVDFTKPVATADRAQNLTDTKDTLVAVAKQLDDTTPTGVAAGMIRWSSANNKWQKYNGTSWADLSSSYAINVTGMITEPAASLAAAGTVDIGAANGRHVTITGNTTISSFGTATAGVWRIVRFTGIPTLTHNATSLILPGGADINVAAGDCLTAVSLGGGNWVVTQYQRATGLPIDAARPAFRANTIADVSAAGLVSGYNELLDKTGSFDPSTGIFTAPYTGNYVFSFVAAADGTANGVWQVGIYIFTGSSGGYVVSPAAYCDVSSGVYTSGGSLSATVVVALNAGDTARIGVPTLPAGMKVNSNLVFSGALL